ncbi:hybrid sensor histidine kinase/response regulator [Bradyrhizobium sp.]|uniref:hybrid sensor histidine kinase/response regulator n=1 Tax=Bradyrhizobium sp. TaxID=376 RepID=UPI0025C09BE7|nr:hybrid sensor histidine kinase/response regulator [Bradyrhizobium sp.]MBV8921321.1 response regulator [Bradyrhizobium sp.]
MQGRRVTVRLIRTAMAASLVLPLALFLFASWTAYERLQTTARERLVRSLDIEQEEAFKTFELVNLALTQVADLLTGMSPEEIAESEPTLHVRLERLSKAIRAVQSIWVYGTDGRPLVSSWAHPPPETSFSDRDFIQAHLAGPSQTYYGKVYASVLNAEPFFTVSRRLVLDGNVVGVIEASVLPSNFFQFFASLAYTQGVQYALLREDGTFLVRFPAVPAGAPDKLGETTGFARTIRATPSGGFYSSISPIDQVSRRYAIRRLENTPLYLSAGIETAMLTREWLSTMGAHLIFGIPATLFLFLTLWLVLRRTQALYAEIDRRSKAEESLRQSQRLEAIGHLTGGVAHDFNNLLTIIIGNLEALQRQMAGAEAQLVRRLDRAMHGATRAAMLTKRLLAFSRQQPLSPAPIDVNNLLNGLAEFLRRALGEHVSLEVVGSGGVWPVEVDATELESALVNLAVNARDAMPNGGKLTIEASNTYLDDAYCRTHGEIEPGQYVLISVSDTGAGMSREVLERAFEPFYTTKPSGQGTGLGLSQVYGFVKQSGGHINLYSETGHGTTAKIYLRRYYGDAPAPRTSDQVSPRANSGESILLVEDDAEVRRYVAETLGNLGYNVLEAGDAKQALQQLQSGASVALLLTDVVMPGMNGRRLAEEARAVKPTLKIIFMTGYSRNAIVHQGRLDPGVDLIQKPIASDQLAAIVRKVLDS